jgi:limonene-1,2-epoxide hydrolase
MTPTAVVTEFLQRLEKLDVDAACDLLAEDVEYVNVSLPAIHGREGVRKTLRRLMVGERSGFEATIHAIAEDGDTVLTDRTDALVYGPVRAEFWVYGRFVVRDGQIVLWRDSFDWANVSAGVVKGLVRAALRRGR